MIIGMWGSLGDEVALTGFIRELKKLYPHEYISVLNKFSELFYNNPHINNGSIFSTYSQRIPTSPHKELNGNFVRCYGKFFHNIPISNADPEVFLTEEEISKYPKPPYNIYAFDTWAGWPSRRLSFEKFIKLVDMIKQYDPSSKVIEVGKSTKDCFGKIRDTYLPNVDESYVDKLPLRETAALLKSCKLFIGNDSGLFHLSAAVGTKQILLIGVPWYKRAYSNTIPVPNTKGCDICFEKCIRQRQCIDYIEPEDVMNLIRRV